MHQLSLRPPCRGKEVPVRSAMCALHYFSCGAGDFLFLDCALRYHRAWVDHMGAGDQISPGQPHAHIATAFPECCCSRPGVHYSSTYLV